MKKTQRMGCHIYTASERYFFNAYRLHADRIGATRDTSVSDSEIDENNWKAPLQWLASEWPEVVARFSVD